MAFLHPPLSHYFLHHGHDNDDDDEKNSDDDADYENGEDAKLAPFCREIIGSAGKLLQKLVDQCRVEDQLLCTPMKSPNKVGF